MAFIKSDENFSGLSYYGCFAVLDHQPHLTARVALYGISLSFELSSSSTGGYRTRQGVAVPVTAQPLAGTRRNLRAASRLNGRGTQTAAAASLPVAWKLNNTFKSSKNIEKMSSEYRNPSKMVQISARHWIQHKIAIFSLIFPLFHTFFLTYSHL